MVTIPHHRNGLTDKVIILDKRTGGLWSWSDPSAAIMYRGQIFPIAGGDTFARIIHVNPKGRPIVHLVHKNFPAARRANQTRKALRHYN